MTREELLKKATDAGSPEELIKLAKEAGVENFTEEDAKNYFEALHKSGELSDEELDSTTGGYCDSHINKAVGAGAQYTSDGYRVVTLGNLCEARFNDNTWGHNRVWECNKCHQGSFTCHCYGEVSDFEDFFGSVLRKVKESCGTCAKCDYRNGLWICKNEGMKRR